MTRNAGMWMPARSVPLQRWWRGGRKKRLILRPLRRVVSFLTGFAQIYRTNPQRKGDNQRRTKLVNTYVMVATKKWLTDGIHWRLPPAIRLTLSGIKPCPQAKYNHPKVKIKCITLEIKVMQKEAQENRWTAREKLLYWCLLMATKLTELSWHILRCQTESSLSSCFCSLSLVCSGGAYQVQKAAEVKD